MTSLSFQRQFTFARQSETLFIISRVDRGERLVEHGAGGRSVKVFKILRNFLKEACKDVPLSSLGKIITLHLILELTL